MEIRILDEGTIDKIAAGEVVDRPASVVKELVENAMDSGADAITVEISDGGLRLIRVTDNGGGIEKEQVARAFIRHATSKIRCADDLLRLSSLGFRGEALSSISAVAQVELVTKAREEMTGVRYVIEGGVEKEWEEIGAPEGTTVLVRNLFYNVPARRKFLKTPQSEGGAISDLMEHLALSHPQISFKYVLNRQVRFHTSGNGNLKEIIYRIYGRDIAGELVWLEKEETGYGLSGFLGTPVIGRANRNFENYFINGRLVKCPVIARAADDAYRSHLMQHKYPFFVLHLSLSPDALDVNVHPSKMEVRFHEQRILSDFIYRAIHDTLTEHEMLRAVTFAEPSAKEGDRKGKAPAEPVPEPFERQARAQQRQREAVQEEAARQMEGAARAGVNQVEEKAAGRPPQEEGMSSRLKEETICPRMLGRNPGVDRRDHEKLHGNIIKKEDHILVERPMQLNLFEERLVSPQFREEYEILGQVFGTYWLVGFRDKLLFIDQHAAHEKVKYERLCQKIRERSVLSQQVDPPVIVTFSGKEEAVYRQYETYFQEIGFEIEPFGGSEYAVRAVPVDLFGRHARELMSEVLDELSEGPVRGEPDVIAGKLASMACKAAVKGNHKMSVEEARALIDELLTLDNPYHCPHGRPTVVVMSRYELEKKFSRIV